jgi:hypothetical protein
MGLPRFIEIGLLRDIALKHRTAFESRDGKFLSISVNKMAASKIISFFRDRCIQPSVNKTR